MVGMNDSSLGGLTAQVSWLGLRVGGWLALFYSHQKNRVDFRNDFAMMMVSYVTIITY